MLTYYYFCTVCGEGASSRQLWLQHLIKESHQAQARLECLKWDKKLQERSLVACCNFPVTDSDILLQWFSSDINLVADFIWSSETPTIAVIQLENKEAVDDAIIKYGTEFSISSDRQVIVKSGAKLSTDQWASLLQSVLAITQQKKMKMTTDYSNSDPVPRPSVSSSSSSMDSNPPPFSNYKTAPQAGISLSVQLKWICKSMLVPKEKYNAAENIVSVLQTRLQNSFGGMSVHIFRNWIFNLRHEYSDYLLLYVTNRIPPQVYLRNLDRPWKASAGHLRFSQIMHKILSSQLNINAVDAPVNKHKRKALGVGKRFEFPSGFQFSITCMDNFLVEAQLCHMMQYLSTCDERLIPLLTLIHYWAKSRNIMLHEDDELLTNHCAFHCLGEPAALEWMVVLFMCREGLLPTPRQLQDHPHRYIPLPKHDIDVGFTEDPEFAAEWKSLRQSLPRGGVSSEEFALSVAKLAQQFFSLFGNALTSGSWILNTRDGQLMSTREVISKGDPVPEFNPWTPDTAHALVDEEINLLRGLHATGGRGVRDPVNFNDTRVFRVYVVNPLYFRWRLSLCNSKLPSICQAMRETAEALQEFLEIWESQGAGDLASYLTK